MATPYSTIKAFISGLSQHIPFFSDPKLVFEKSEELNNLLRHNNIVEAKALLSRLPPNISGRIVNIKQEINPGNLQPYFTNVQAPLPSFSWPIDYAQSAEGVALLKQYGANLNKVDSNRETPIWRAFRRANHEVFRELLKQGVDTNTFHSDIFPGSPDLFSALFSYCLDTKEESLKALPNFIKILIEESVDMSDYLRQHDPLSKLIFINISDQELKSSVAKCFRYLFENNVLEQFLTSNPQSNLDENFIRLSSFKSTNEEIFSFMLERLKTLPELQEVYKDFSIQHSTISPTAQYELRFLEMTRNKIKALEEKLLLDQFLPLTPPQNNQEVPINHKAKKQKI